MSVTQLVRSTQIKPGTAYRIVVNDSTGKMAENAALTVSRVLASDANGQLAASATTATELGYLSGVGSSIQNQLDALAWGLSWKNAVRVATIANVPGFAVNNFIVDNGNATYLPTDAKGIFIDGIELAVNDRVLVKSQTAPEQNGIYKVTVVGLKDSIDAELERALDMADWTGVPAAAVFAEEGTINADLGFVCTSDEGGILGTTAITFVQFSTFAAGITQLTGEVTAGPGSGSQAATVTNSAVIGKLITGYVSGAGTVADTDTILAAINKLNGNTAATVIVANAALPSASFTDAAVTSKLITGYSSGAGVVAATDTILEAVNKLNGNTAVKVAKAGDTMTGALTIDPISNQLVLGGVSAGFKVTISSTAPSADRVLTIPAATGNRNFLLSGEAAIVTGDISASAAITLSQLASIGAAKIIVGAVSTGIATAVDMSGDATISNTGVLTLSSTGLGTGHFVTREVPTGAIDGLNCAFALAATPISGTEHVFLNGILQNVGSGNDYQISTDTITFNSVAATPSGTITYGDPSGGGAVIFTGLPNAGGVKTFTYDATPEGDQFSTIGELTTLINALTDLNATDNGTVITMTVVTKGTQMNSATVTGTDFYSALSLTFSGGTTNAPQTGSVLLVSSHK